MNQTILKTLSFIGAAVKEGQLRPGVSKTPSILRSSGLFENLQQIYGVTKIKDFGDIDISSIPKEIVNNPPSFHHNVNNLHLLDPLLKNVHDTVKRALNEEKEDNVVVTVGGDHSIGSATISAALTKHPDLKVVWVDAHADFVNPDIKGIPNQNYHGMPLAHVSGVAKLPNFQWMKKTCLPFENIVLIGIRDMDHDEFISLKKHGVKCFTMDHVDKYGIGKVMKMTMDYLDPHNRNPFHISFDVDGVDPSIASQTGTRYRDGLNHREACHIVRRLAN